MYKKKVLFCSEASYLNTGYSTMTHEILLRLHNTGKYDIAELATYGMAKDPRIYDIPWTFFPNMPTPGNTDEQQAYESKSSNQFGEWKFEETCLKFRPDVVIDFRDPWMCQFELYSPFRRFYQLLWMPTVDAYPQDAAWLSDYSRADAVLTYTNFGARTLTRQAGNSIKQVGVASPGIDTTTFFPAKDKAAHKKSMGFSPDKMIIGTVIRNQKRKLYPDILDIFQKFLEKAPIEIAKKSYLYLHTAYPDVGWNIPQLLKEFGVSHRVLFTYLCRHCNYITGGQYCDVYVTCPRCKTNNLITPNPQHGLSRQHLAQIYNLMDVYLQYSVSEGFGIPVLEAAACGVPVMVVNYSGMEDFPETIGAIPIRPLKCPKEVETHRNMAVPDNNQCIDELIKFMSLPKTVQQKKGIETYMKCKAHYDWNTIIKVWEQSIDNLPTKPHLETWESPPQIYSQHLVMPDNLSNEDFVRWAIINIANEPSLINSYIESKFIKDLNYGQMSEFTGYPYFSDLSAIGVRPKMREFNRDNIIKEMMNFINHKNYWEEKRVTLLQK